MERFGDFIYMHRCTLVLLQCQHRCAPDFSVLHRWTGAVLKDAGARTPVRTTFHSYTPVCWCGAKKFWCKHTGAWWIFSVAPVLAPVHSKNFPLHRCAAPVWCAILVHTTSLVKAHCGDLLRPSVLFFFYWTKEYIDFFSKITWLTWYRIPKLGHYR